MGRFNSIDIQAASYHSMTPYQFAGNDPIYWNDPNGDVLFAPIERSIYQATAIATGSGGFGGGLEGSEVELPDHYLVALEQWICVI